MADTLLWISGATSGIGAAMARTCPYADAEIVNLSRSRHAELPSIPLDLTDPATWGAAVDDFTTRLAGVPRRAGRSSCTTPSTTAGRSRARASPRSSAPRSRRTSSRRSCWATRSCGPRSPRWSAGVEVGLVQMSSGAAKLAYPGLAVYGAGKAAMEQWVRTVRMERTHRGGAAPWVIAVRPGFVDTPAAHKDAAQPADDFPAAPALAESLATGVGVLDPDVAAREIWAALPPTGERSVLFFGEAVGAS